MRTLLVMVAFMALLVLSPHALGQGSASGDTYKDPFPGQAQPTPGAPSSQAKERQTEKPATKTESSGPGPGLVVVLVVAAILAAGALTVGYRRRSRRDLN